METENLNGEQMELNTTHTAEADENLGGKVQDEISYGKFKDATSLLKAYENLEAEFTRRSQRLKELEGTLNHVDEGEQTATDSPTNDNVKTEETGGEVSSNVKVADKYTVDEIKNDSTLSQEIIKDYLLKLVKSKPICDLTGGMGIVAPPHKPTTIAEASALTKEYIKLKGER